MSRRSSALILSALLAAALPAPVAAQEETSATTPMWAATTRQEARDVGTLGDGFVAVGGKDERPAGKVWLSPDGEAWSRIEDERVFDGAVPRRVTSFGDGAVVLGTKGRKLMAWYSLDGESWSRTAIDSVGRMMSLFPDDVTDGPAGLIAVASVIAQDLAGQRFYRSTDGLSWQEIDPPSETAPGMFVALESTADEYFAIARPLFEPSEDLYWRSSDGLAWEPFDGPAEGYLHDLAVSDGTYVGVGHLADDATSAIWHADELGAWELVYEAPSAKETEEHLDVVALGGPGFIASGGTSSCPEQANRYCPEASILVSSDGQDWRALGVDDGVPGPLADTIAVTLASNGAATAMVTWHERRATEIWTMPPTDE